MEGGLFKKYELRIVKNTEDKKELIKYIEEKTLVLLNEKEIQIDNKKVKIQTSSTKRLMIISRDIKTVLKEKGYTLSY
jgi:hypothetical protein